MAKRKSKSKSKSAPRRRSPAKTIKAHAPGMIGGAIAAAAAESVPAVAKYGDNVPGGTSTIAAAILIGLSRMAKGKRRAMLEDAAMGAVAVAAVDIYRGRPVTLPAFGGAPSKTVASQLRSLPTPRKQPADFLAASRKASEERNSYGMPA